MNYGCPHYTIRNFPACNAHLTSDLYTPDDMLRTIPAALFFCSSTAARRLVGSCGEGDGRGGRGREEEGGGRGRREEGGGGRRREEGEREGRREGEGEGERMTLHQQLWRWHTILVLRPRSRVFCACANSGYQATLRGVGGGGGGVAWG